MWQFAAERNWYVFMANMMKTTIKRDETSNMVMPKKALT